MLWCETDDSFSSDVIRENLLSFWPYGDVCLKDRTTTTFSEYHFLIITNGYQSKQIVWTGFTNKLLAIIYSKTVLVIFSEISSSGLVTSQLPIKHLTISSTDTLSPKVLISYRIISFQ